MPSKHLVDFVNQLKKSGIKISFTKPRPMSALNLQQIHEISSNNKDCLSNRDKQKTKRNQTLLKFI